MELFMKVGDQVITATPMKHGTTAVGTYGVPMDTHRVVLADSLTADMELVTLDSELEVMQFVREFLEPKGYPAGGIYDTTVKSDSFRM